MNKNAVKEYAIWARRELIGRVSQKAFEYGIENDHIESASGDVVKGVVLTNEQKIQRQALVTAINTKGFDQVMEEVAYTWFNRFIALRFMEANNYLPQKVRPFTDEENKFNPQLITDALDLEFVDKNTIYSYKDKNDTDGLYKYLLISLCNDMNQYLPQMFAKIEDYTTLLFPDNLLREGSVVSRLISDIDEDSWNDQVQIIGWLFETYVQTNREEFRKDSIVSKKNMATVNQVFTPDWIVKYMVQNTIGRMWVESHKNSLLRNDMEYYIDNDSCILSDRILMPEDIKFIEPCCGSGHVLVYVFDLLFLIYEEAGYAKRDIPEMILKNNIWGFDIDGRAAQLAYFAVMMKARSIDRTFFKKDINPHIYEYIDSSEVDNNYASILNSYSPSELCLRISKYLVSSFEYGKVLGTTTIFQNDDYDAYIEELSEMKSQQHSLFDMYFFDHDVERLIEMARIAKALSKKFDVLITNPPYSIISKLEQEPKKYLVNNYPNNNVKCNLCSIFLESGLVKRDGYISMLTSTVWTKQGSFENVRKSIIDNNYISSMLFIGEEEVNAMVDTVAFVIRKCKSDEDGKYYSLINCDSRSEFMGKVHPNSIRQNDFHKLKGSIITDNFNVNINNVGNQALKDVLVGRDGLHTCDNERFLRLWCEVDFEKVNLHCKNIEESIVSKKKWFPYCKGGEYRQYYGNNNYLVNWFNDGKEVKALIDEKTGKVKSHGYNGKYSFAEGFTWTYRTHANFAARYVPGGFLFDGKGSMAFSTGNNSIVPIVGYMNSVVARYFMGRYATTAFEVSTITNVPFHESILDPEVETFSKSNISLSKSDYDSFETSWDFEEHPLLKNKVDTIKKAYTLWDSECNDRFNTLKNNEEELNRIFIDIYGLKDELTPEVEDKDVTVRKADLTRDIKSLISYAVGCMFGRYSLDSKGLAYAGGEWNNTKYSSFIPDADNIIPISDDEFFEDDITGRFISFIETAYGKDTLEENLQFIADSLGGKGTSRQIIRNYFVSQFFADHCNTYQVTGSGKRPIYWLFDSGKKNGFKALIYMHRYTPDLLAKMRTDYVHEQQERYRTQIENLESEVLHLSGSEKIKAEKILAKYKDQLTETSKFEEKLHHLADKMISIDLDDGFKQNYPKFEDVVAKVK